MPERRWRSGPQQPPRSMRLFGAADYTAAMENRPGHPPRRRSEPAHSPAGWARWTRRRNRCPLEIARGIAERVPRGIATPAERLAGATLDAVRSSALATLEFDLHAAAPAPGGDHERPPRDRQARRLRGAGRPPRTARSAEKPPRGLDAGRLVARSPDPCRPSGSRCPPVGPTSTTRSATTAVRSPRARGSTELPPRGRSTLQSPAPAGGTPGPRIPGGTRGPKIPPAGGVSHPHTRHFRPIHASAPAGGILGPTHPPATPSRSAPQVGLLPRLHRPNPRIRGRRQVRGPWPGPPPRRGAPGRGRGRRRSDGSPPAPGRAVRSPAGCCSPARRAPEARRGHRRRCAQGRSSLLVELGEVAGQGRVLKRPAREPSVEAAERSGVTPGGCSG